MNHLSTIDRRANDYLNAPNVMFETGGPRRTSRSYYDDFHRANKGTNINNHNNQEEGELLIDYGFHEGSNGSYRNERNNQYYDYGYQTGHNDYNLSSKDFDSSTLLNGLSQRKSSSLPVDYFYSSRDDFLQKDYYSQGSMKNYPKIPEEPYENNLNSGPYYERPLSNSQPTSYESYYRHQSYNRLPPHYENEYSQVSDHYYNDTNSSKNHPNEYDNQNNQLPHSYRHDSLNDYDNQAGHSSQSSRNLNKNYEYDDYLSRPNDYSTNTRRSIDYDNYSKGASSNFNDYYDQRPRNAKENTSLQKTKNIKKDAKKPPLSDRGIVKNKQESKNERTVKKKEKKKEIAKVQTKKSLCRFWMEGTCKKGEDCLFSHEAEPNKNIGTKSEICKFFMNGSCLKADKCPFSHDLKKIPCRFFHVKGKCASRESCKFSHEPVDPETKERIIQEYNQAQQQQQALIQKDENEGQDYITQSGHYLTDSFLNPFASPF